MCPAEGAAMSTAPCLTVPPVGRSPATAGKTVSELLARRRYLVSLLLVDTVFPPTNVSEYAT
jgi:hypothetical protein